MTSPTIEQMVDVAVQRRLDYDPAYRNAATAEQQAVREAEITREEEQKIRDRLEGSRF